MADFKYSAGIDVNLNIKNASSQLQELQKQLQQISNMKVDIGTGNLTADIEKASEAAMKLSAHLATAMNPRTGNLDFTKFYTSIQKSGASLQEYGEALQRMGPAGQKAFVSLADSISKAEIPLKRTSQMVDKMWDGLKRTASWQLQSTIIHGIIGSIQSAVGYAKDLNSSLNDIRIVTGQSTDQMAKFAKEANKAAKNLSTTTTDYTKASLIYYQQGLSDAEVKQRTEATIKMANVSGQSAQNVSSQMTAIWNNFDNGSKSLEYYGDVITALGAKTASSSEEIAQGIQKFAAISDTIGLSYEYAASALATVTATTRESADVVGNAYKTLFSRIQGLNLGETLDDGTTLNKYSTALAKVGISIKDSSGNLKDMDSILNEMGSKWETLSKDQQMGLAQTVAGVRQYTQLVALMDNWDTFQQNLQTAKTSTGTLDQQAAIHAESWEAASDRVRASWEGLWDNLISSDSMITILDGVSLFAKAMDNLASSIGGAGGVLTSFLGIATKIFAPQISQGLRNIAYTTSMMFGGEKKVEAQRQTFLKDAREKINVEGELGSLYGQNESEARISIMDQQLAASSLYADRYRYLSPLQQQVESQYSQAINAQNLRIIQAANSLDDEQNKLFEAKMNTSFINDSLKGNGNNKSGLDSYLNYTSGYLKEMQTAEDLKTYMANYQGSKSHMRKEPEYIRLMNLHSAANKALGQENVSTPTVGTKLTGFADSLKNVYDVVNDPKAKKSSSYIQDVSNALTSLQEAGYSSKDTIKYIEGAKATLAAGGQVDFNSLYAHLIQTQGITAGGTGEIGAALTEYLSRMFGVKIGKVQLEEEQQRGANLNQGRTNNLNQQANIDWANTMVQAGQGAMMALSAGQSLTALGESINNGTADAMSSIMSIVSMVSQFGMAMASFAAIFKNITAVASTALGATGLGAIIAGILTLLPAIFQGIDHLHASAEERAVQEAKTQSELNNAYQQAENHHQNLIKSIDVYGEAQDALSQLTAGTTEWTNSLYEANKAAMNIISANNLTEGKDYYRDPNGLLKINQSTLDNIEKANETSLNTVEVANQLKQIERSSEKVVEDNKENLAQELLTKFSNHPFWDIIDKQQKGETLSEKEQAILDSTKTGEGNHFMWDDSSYSQNIISAITTAYLKNSSVLDSIGSIDEALIQKGYFASDVVIDSIYAMRDSIKASTANIQEQYENEAREILSDESYSNKDEVMAASGRLLMNEYNKVKENYDNNYKEWAQEYADATGLSKLKDFHIGSTDANGNVRYTYTDEKGNPVTNQTMDKGAIQQYQIASTTLTNLENSANQLDTIFTSLNAKGDKADGALESYIAEKGFGKATLKEMQALTGALNGQETQGEKAEAIKNATGLNKEQQEKIAELEGVTYETWVDGLINSLTKATVDVTPYADRVKTRLGAQATVNEDKSISWNWQSKDNLSNFVDDLNVENLKLLDSTLTNIKAMEGQSGLDSYVDALVGLIESADDVDSNSLIQMLLNLENTGSAAGNLQAIQAIIEGLGGSFEGATSAAQYFAAALAGINTSGLDSVLSKINQIKNALGDVFSLETGSNVGEDVYNNIIKAFPELEGLFTEDILNGGYRYTGSEGAAKGAAKSAYMDMGKDIAQYQQWKDNINETMNDASGQALSMSEWAQRQADVIKANDIETSQGEDQDRQNLINDQHGLGLINAIMNGQFGQGAIDAIMGSGIKGAFNKDGTFNTNLEAEYMAKLSEREALFNNASDENNDGIIDKSDLGAEEQVKYNNLTAEINEKATVINALMSFLTDITETDWDEKSKDFEANRGQLADGTDELRNMYNIDESTMASMNGSGTTLSSNKDLQNYAENLAFLANQYPEVSEMASQLSEALMAGNYAMAEGLIPLVETGAALAAASDEYGHTTEEISAMASHLKELNKDNDQFQKNIANSPQKLAKISAEMLDAAEAADEWEKMQSDVAKILRDTSKKGTQPYIDAINKASDAMTKMLRVEDSLQKTGMKLSDDFKNKLAKNIDKVNKAMKGDFNAEAEIMEDAFKDLSKTIPAAADVLAKFNLDKINEELAALKESGLFDLGDSMNEQYDQMAAVAPNIVNLATDMWNQLVATGKMNTEQYSALMDLMGFDVSYKTVTASEAASGHFNGVKEELNDSGTTYTVTGTDEGADAGGSGSGQVTIPEITAKGQGGGSGGGGGGGGGGGPKEPKKVANKRKSQTVKRYKRNDAKRSSAEKSKKSEENKKDYLYGESKIAQMEKINKLAEKEAKITSDRIKESRTYLIEDRENLIKYLQKYGYEAEFDADGFLANYEQVWTDIYKQIAALYEDNLLTDEEAKIEEDLNVMLEELEGALEDYENSLSELQDDIEAYEETLFEMYDNKVEALEHKVEFKIELSEDDLDYLDFWIESLGDNVYNALEAIEAMGAKANALFDGLETYQQGIIDIMSLSDDPLQVWATGGIEGILTQAQVDALRDNRDGLADYMQQLIDLRDEIKDKVLDTFDSWQEKLDSTLTTIEHYTSVLEHFKNMIDVVGKDSLGLSNQFMANLEQNAINQSLDSIDANKAYYDNLVEIQQEAQEKLEEARARGDQSSADHWEEIVKSTTETMQDAQDALLTSLEDSLNLIAEQFETNMERAVEAFNDAIYAYGGLEGLSNDYSLIRENADLMAADYEKIYELSKITRNINKTLDDTNIIAGKQKLISLQKEINNLQNSGVELSKYDLEYLQAKYELRLAEIELENAQNAKDTVRLSRDSEGNWSYIYTQNADAVEEAGQKYEDALYEMQKLSQEYLEEMSSSMLDTSSAMMEEISGLRIQDFNSYEEYQAEIKRIQDKYAESLKLQESELNKAVSNSQQIYEQDWRNYNLITGYKISESEKWVDAFKESTIGQLLNSDTIMSSFSDTFLGLTEILTKNLADSAVSYFTNIDKAFATYGTSIEDFGKHVEDSTKKISDKSKEAARDAKKMASEMNDAFKEIADTVSNWQEQFSSEIDKMLEKIKTLIQDINEAIETSANLQSDNRNSSELIGQDEAIDLLNEQKLWGTWGRSENGALTLNGNATTFTDFNGELIQEIDDKMTKMFNAKTGSEERSKLEEEVKELFKQYWLFKDIVGRVYDVTDLQAPTYASLDTGGYTGEWGDSGKFAMLHEKELVLNKDDTKNFLDALNLSKDIINSMIEMNAKQSSLALGDLVPTSIQDMSQVLEQSVTIQAEFPNATDHSEIEEAFNNLINTASQYANRRK